MRSARSSLAALLLLALAACADTPTPPPPPEATAAQAAGPQVPSRAEQRPGTWLDLSDAELWRAVQASGGVAAVGLKAPGQKRGVWRGQLLIRRAEWLQARQNLLTRRGITVLAVDELLPIVEVRLADADALAALRRLPFVDYVEPVLAAQAMPTLADVGGCGWGSAWSGDWQYTPQGDVYTEKYTAMGIPAAWGLSSGRGVTVGITDTGISSTQAELTSGFATGESAGRTLRLLRVSSKSSAYDQCGHGTRMSGVLAAPRNGQNVTGVAWGANLVSVRHADGVAAVSSSAAREGVRVAAQNGARVVVMAWESLNWFWQVSDEIEYWYYNGARLFLAAAGTSGCGDLIPDGNVVFPAEMGEVIAVTGFAYPTTSVPCGIHHGPEVDVVAYLDVPTTGRNTGELVGIGGSSNATAVMGGIAALVWSANPSLTRDQVRERLYRAAAGYPTRSSRHGYGLVNAYRAVTGQ